MEEAIKQNRYARVVHTMMPKNQKESYIKMRKELEKLTRKAHKPSPDRAKTWKGGKLITMRQKDYLREHHHLFKVLSHPTKKKLLKELMAQQNELKERGLKGGKTRRRHK